MESHIPSSTSWLCLPGKLFEEVYPICQRQFVSFPVDFSAPSCLLQKLKLLLFLMKMLGSVSGFPAESLQAPILPFKRTVGTCFLFRLLALLTLDSFDTRSPAVVTNTVFAYHLGRLVFVFPFPVSNTEMPQTDPCGSNASSS